jgi:cobalamin biosynthesis Co2+ chelatase CbiK
VATLKKGKKDYIVRIGCTKRSGAYWLSRYKSEGFKKIGLTTIDIVNKNETRFTIDQCKEMFIFDLATRLEDSSNPLLEKITDYKYRMKNIKVLKKFLLEHTNGYVISGTEEEPVVHKSLCTIM